MRLKSSFLSLLRGGKADPTLGDLSNAIASTAWKAVSAEAGAVPSCVIVYARLDPAFSESRISMMTLYIRSPGDVVESLHGPGTRDVMDAVEAQRTHLLAGGQAPWLSLTQRIDSGRFETDMTYEATPELSLGTWDTGQWLKRKHFGQAG
jgi:hypothetical protein